MAGRKGRDRSREEQKKSDDLLGTDLGTQVTSTGGERKPVVGAEQRKGEPAAAGDTPASTQYRKHRR